jgi:hypothetical protein
MHKNPGQPSLAWVPYNADGFGWASVDAGGLLGFGFAGGAGVLDFFAVLLGDGGDCFVL